MKPRPQDLTVDQLSYYAALSADVGARKSISRIYIPKQAGKACAVAAHQVLRVTCCDGPQVADFNAFAQNDPSEYFWSGRTRTLQGSHLHVGDRLWSTEPKMRPMFTFITDTVEKKPQPHNATSHDLIYSRCSERARELQTGKRGQPNCNDNLKQALREIGFADDYVHDAFNIFMTTGCDDQRRLFYVPSEAKKDDFVELYAEIDAIVAISCCLNVPAELIDKDPQLVKGLVVGVKQGLAVTFDDPAELKRVAQLEFPSASPEDLAAVLDRALKNGMWERGAPMSREAWDTLYKVIREGGLLTQAMPYESVFDPRFLN